MTADADRPSAGNVALVRKYLEKHGVTSTEDGRIVIATLLEKVSKKHDDFCNEMAERIEAATASQRKRIDALTAREAALLSQVATLREALDKSYNGPEADLPRTVERLLHNTAEAAARRDEAIRREMQERCALVADGEHPETTPNAIAAMIRALSPGTADAGEGA